MRLLLPDVSSPKSADAKIVISANSSIVLIVIAGDNNFVDFNFY